MAIALPLDLGKAPERFRVWTPGVNTTEKGPVNFTAKAAQEVLGEQERRGTAIPIDIEHNSNPSVNPAYDVNDPPEGGGYLVLKVVDTQAGPELWADPVRWSRYARDQIESGSRNYFSPDADLLVDTNEPVRVNKISLCQDPATHSIPLLASRTVGKVSTMLDLNTIKSALSAAQAIAAGSEDPEMQGAAQAFAEKLAASAASLGLDLTGEAEPPAAQPEDAPPMAAPPPAPEEKKDPVPMTASKTSALTIKDVERVIREDNEKRNLIATAMNRPGMTPALANILAAAPLPDARRFISALPPAPKAEEKPVAADAVNEKNLTAAAEKAGVPVVQEQETEHAAKLRRAFGLRPEDIANTQARMKAGTAGKASLDNLLASKRAAKAAK